MDNGQQLRTYGKELKNEVIRLVLEECYKATEVERNLGIGNNIVSRWVRESKEDPEDAFPDKGRLKPPDEEILTLTRELERVKRERDILKKHRPSS
jgi:transposase